MNATTQCLVGCRIVDSARESLERFLSSKAVEYGPDLFISMIDFRRAYNEYCTSTGFPKEIFTEDFYCGAFTTRSLVITSERREYPVGSGKQVLQMYVMGCRTKSLDAE